MMEPIIAAINAHAPALLQLGNPPRVYPAGDAPAVNEPSYALPYLTWQTVSGLPNWNMDTAPTDDEWIVQVSVYAGVFSDSKNAAIAVRDAVEKYPGGYIHAWRGERRDEATRLYGYTFDVAFAVER